MKSAQDQRESLIQIITKPSTKVPLEVIKPFHQNIIKLLKKNLSKVMNVYAR